MSKDDLIEALAKAIHAWEHAWETEGEGQMDGGCERCRETINDLALVPVIVDVVATWIANQSGVNVVAEDAEYMVKAWREEMA